MPIHKREIFFYETPHGKAPFEEWLESLRDRQARVIIRTKLDRLEEGYAGRCEPVGEGQKDYNERKIK